MKKLTHSRLLEVLTYDKKTGLFRWNVAIGRSKIGKVAGSPMGKGYIQIRIDGEPHLAHRLAWFYVTGEWPTQVDHRNTVRSDNRWRNLRQATNAQNAMNSKLRSNNTSGRKGAYRHGSRWAARIRMDGKVKHIGTFDTCEQAHAAYMAEAKKREPLYARAA